MSHWTEQDLERIKKLVHWSSVAKQRMGSGVQTLREAKVKLTEQSVRTSASSSPYRSKLEAAWASYLNGLVMLKAIRSVHYEPLNLRLPGEKNFYKPDFLTVGEFGLTFYEVKGRNKSDDRSLVKIKTAAGITPWARFVLVKRIRGQWEERTIT